VIGEPLFVTARGRRLRTKTFAEAFRRDLVRLGLEPRSRIADGVRFGAPGLHALRHSFAVHRLLQWYREGADVQAKLPLLSTFLGHVHIRHTQVYLTITRALLEEGRRRFAGRWEKEFPLAP
jgi:integrase